ncbi:hypothetical protein BCR44DRAFT_71238 [Catenaria anguillulae PL171]|uniref:Uncharacterized protein n=1 Tax=Catenaria anguillulae PL171 TaxID=765915 RepID=A0A1Y2HGK1_9FUNG|nr:hypothetical protein BCR44DRAFT_71238 [Catenaria anguillulae PL171]
MLNPCDPNIKTIIMPILTASWPKSPPRAPCHQALADPIIESIVIYAIRNAPLTFSTDAPNLTRPLNVLSRSFIPLASLAAIARLPWIDSNVASLRNDLWLLGALMQLARKHPYRRPLQYLDTKLMDEVSARGLIDVLTWWHKSGLLIAHEHALQLATDNGHTPVLQWWKDSGRLTAAKSPPVSLVEASRRAHLATLDWWLNNAKVMDISLWAIPAAMYIAFKSEHGHVADWWAKHSSYFGPAGDTERAIAAAVAAGNQECMQALLLKRDGVKLSPTLAACALLSDDLDWIEAMIGPPAEHSQVNIAWATECANPGSLEYDLIQAVLLDSGATNYHAWHPSVWYLCSILGYSNVLDWWMTHAREHFQEALASNPQLVDDAQLDACRNHQAATVKWWLEQARMDQLSWNSFICYELVEIVAENGLVDMANDLLHLADGLCGIHEALQDNDCNFLRTAMVYGHFALVDWWIANIEQFPYADLRSEHDRYAPCASYYPDNLFQATLDVDEHNHNFNKADDQRSHEDGRAICHVDTLRMFGRNSWTGGVSTKEVFDLLAHVSSATPSPFIDFRVSAHWQETWYSRCGPHPLALVRLLEVYPPKGSTWKHDLDRAVSVRAGVAMLDWILASGRSRHSLKGYRYALSHSGGSYSIEARWWVKNGLVTE